MNWFSFYTQIHAEKRARQAIEGLGFPVFIPFERRIQRLPHRKPRAYEAPLFPRYGFVKFDPTDYRWGAIKDAKGVVDILRNNGNPVVIHNSIIDGLKLMESTGVLDRTQPHKVGQRVLVNHGPFGDIIGRVMKVRARERIDVLLNFFGSQRVVTVPIMSLREA